jgi:hypothetical protein
MIGRGESTPRRMRIYANRPNIVDFSDAEDLRPHLDIRLLQGEAGVTEYPLRTAVFANVNSVSVFLVSCVLRLAGCPIPDQQYRMIVREARCPVLTSSGSRETPAT